MKQSENLTKFEIAMAILLVGFALFVSLNRSVDDYNDGQSCHRDSYGMTCD